MTHNFFVMVIIYWTKQNKKQTKNSNKRSKKNKTLFTLG